MPTHRFAPTDRAPLDAAARLLSWSRSRLVCALIASALTACAACTGSDDYVIVTVAAHASVRDARALAITLTNADTTRMDTLALDGAAFPVTFSVSAPGRTGDLAIAIDATADTGLTVGRGAAHATLGDDTARVVLDATDFVVNTAYAGDQLTSSDFEASGFQLAARPDGTWTAAMRDDCPDATCTFFARRFDPTGAPVPTAGAPGAFPLTTHPTTAASAPALAASATTTLAVWDFFDPDPPFATGVACRAIDARGAATTIQRALSDDLADVVSVAALATGDFVASWTTASGGLQGIRALRIAPDCTPLGAPLAMSEPGGAFIHRAAVAASRDRVLFTWIVEGDLHARVMSNAGVLLTADTLLAPRTATDQIVHARSVAGDDGGFLVATRWARNDLDTGPGQIDLLHLDADGLPVGAPILITDQSASDADNRESFGFARRADTAMIAWHTCGPLGDDSGCGVFARILHTTGVPLGDPFRVPTTTTGDQTRPSVAGLPTGFAVLWTDASEQPPDTTGLAVRARIITP